MARDTADRVREAASDIGGRANRMMRGAGNNRPMGGKGPKERRVGLADAASGYARQGRERIKEFGETVGEQVQERPLTTLLLALGLGLLLGAFFARR